MPDLKISQLNNGDPAQSNDQIPINRAGVNFRLTAGSIAALSPPTTPAGSDTQVQFNDGGVFGGDAAFTFAKASGLLTASVGNFTSTTANQSSIAASSYSLTGSSDVSMVDLAGTWNTTGAPTAIKLNVTDTASNAASLLMDLQVGGSSRFSVNKAGTMTATALASGSYQLTSAGIITEAGTTRTLSATDNGKVIYCTSNSAITITCAAGLGAGFSCTIIQAGTGKITVAAGGQTLVSYSSLVSTAGQYAAISVICPVANTFLLSGNLGV
jgi:hypothetical protein